MQVHLSVAVGYAIRADIISIYETIVMKINVNLSILVFNDLPNYFTLHNCQLKD